MTEIYATADFRAYGVGNNGKEFDKKVHCELYKSGAFDYGNGTGMSVEFEGSMEQCYDTRYEPVSAENFKEYALEFLKGIVINTITVEPIE